MTEGIPTTKEENERQYKVIDQMLTMHSSYRDCMARRAFWLNTALVASALFLTVFSFVDDNLIKTLGFDPAMSRFTLGLTAVVVLLCSITEFRVDWNSLSGRHAEAVTQLAAMKTKYRKSFAQTGGDDTRENTSLASVYEEVMGGLPVIPERWFNTLKAEHRFKRILSERISECPKAPAWFLRLQLRVEGLRDALRLGKERYDGQSGGGSQTA